MANPKKKTKKKINIIKFIWNGSIIYKKFPPSSTNKSIFDIVNIMNKNENILRFGTEKEMKFDDIKDAEKYIDDNYNINVIKEISLDFKELLKVKSFNKDDPDYKYYYYYKDEGKILFYVYETREKNFIINDVIFGPYYMYKINENIKDIGTIENHILELFGYKITETIDIEKM